MRIAIVENDSSFLGVAVRLNEKVAAIAFYAILVVSIIIFGFGITFKDNTIIVIGIS